MIADKMVIVDLNKCEHIGMLQPMIKKAFDFPDGYGHNWSAFKDFLFWEYPVSKVVVKGADALPPIFRRDMEIFHKILEEMKTFCESREINFEYEFR